MRTIFAVSLSIYLSGIENAEQYEADICIISIMRMDFELLTEIVEDLDGDEGCRMKELINIVVRIKKLRNGKNNT